MKQQRLAKVKKFVEDNDVESFRFLNLSKSEYLKMRFDSDMNLLQLVCFEEAHLILEQMRHKFANDQVAKRSMANHKDSHLGSQAIHLASATGNRYITEVLMLDFEGNPFMKTEGD